MFISTDIILRFFELLTEITRIFAASRCLVRDDNWGKIDSKDFQNLFFKATILVFGCLCGQSRTFSHGGINIFACNYLFNYLFLSSVNMLKISDFHLLVSSGLTTVYIFDTSFGSSCFCGLDVKGWCWGFIVYVVCYSYPLFCPTHVFQNEIRLSQKGNCVSSVIVEILYLIHIIVINGLLL